jgi:hypothetical protein
MGYPLLCEICVQRAQAEPDLQVAGAEVAVVASEAVRMAVVCSQPGVELGPYGRLA